MRLHIIAALVLAASPLHAQSVGLILGNEEYENVGDVSRGDRVVRAEKALSRAGMQIVARQDATLDDMTDALSEFGQMADRSDTLLVVLAGRFVHTVSETYFLPVDAETGPMATLAANTLPLSTVMAWLASAPGHAVLVLATDDAQMGFGAYLTAGIGDLDIPQGVTVLTGAPAGAEKLLTDIIARPGQNIAQPRLGMTVQGFAPEDLTLLQAQSAAPTPAPAPAPAPDLARRADIADWRRASAADTAEGYQGYIDAHPSGEFVQMANNRIRALTDTPQARAERAEQALDLSRDARREIQRDLTLLEFNTRGIDGIFGRGTRSAIQAWQTAQGVESTGYMTADQITRLDAQAERRAQELEAEAERRRQELLRADLAFWDETGAVGDEAGLRAYLARYPDGEYAEIATERLRAIEDRTRSDADVADRRYWDNAQGLDTVGAYEEYLRLSNRGAFTDAAEARILELEEEDRNAEERSAAARQEDALGLSPRTRQIVEARLEKLELKPGKVDGEFDNDTRRAIRRYQAARNMDETGYLSEAVVVQLLADSVRSIFR